ncbi:MAG: MoaD/ThiS family protein [Desulfobacteraceae bacterium]|nr:MoaD/ThiS family protein [Desulfobacteraceae bacterium]
MIKVDDKNMDWFENMTVSDLIKRIENTDHCAAVRLNNVLVSSPNFDKTIIPDNAEIYLLPLIAGG